MYYPYLRGKQFELIVVREMAALLADNNIIPIIEPVRDNLTGLQKSLNEIIKYKGKIIVVINPKCGDFQSQEEKILKFLKEKYFDEDLVMAGILLNSDTTLEKALTSLKNCKELRPVLIHSGFTNPKELAQKIKDNIDNLTNIFIEKKEEILYRRHFDKGKRVLINDGFIQMRNADYPFRESFSDLHITYADRKLDGFGDFLIVGDNYSESGGPAYAVAIHLTYINSQQDDIMFVYHFVSIDKNTPTDPAGKFAQALEKLIDLLNDGESMLYETKAIQEFRSLHEKGHFPGLGVIKKLSMMHHIETISIYQKLHYEK